MTDASSVSIPYYPPPESQGGWRWLQELEDVRTLAEMDPEQLNLVRQQQLFLQSLVQSAPASAQ